jgi:hypothetical protein
MVPVVCPICRSEKLQQTVREVLLSAHAMGLTSKSAGAVAYRCDAGHIFLIVDESFSWGEAMPDGSGYSIVV